MKEKMFVLVIGIIFVLFGASIIPSISGINKSLSEDKGTAHQMQIFGIFVIVTQIRMDSDGRTP